MNKGKWFERCVSHYDDSAIEFFKDYFSDSKKTCLTICGAGFDPRSTRLIEVLSKTLESKMSVKTIKEQRPDPSQILINRADENLKIIEGLCSNHENLDVDIFSKDGAVVAGRRVIEKIKTIEFSKYSDIIIEMSALSMGVSFPIIAFLYKLIEDDKINVNLHLALVSNPDLDHAIKSLPNDATSNIHGFPLENLSGAESKIRLWMPVLSVGKENQLKTIYNSIKPNDTCPILPFPTKDPKKGDKVAWSIIDAIRSDWRGLESNEWGLDLKNFVYSDEQIPLDIYRTILRISGERSPVFETFGGSTIILSPLGSKVPKLGILMAALEKEFPIVYVESRGYNVDWAYIDDHPDPKDSKIVHIWLCGEAYLKTTNS